MGFAESSVSRTDRPPLLGREVESSRVDLVLDRARRGRSGGLLIRGEPGVGKTAMIRYALERAEGMTVISTTAVEVESEIAFAGLADLLRPLVSYIPALPEPQAQAIAGALDLQGSDRTDSFTIYVATLGVFALAAESSPLLVAIDDVHWLDTASQRALLFAARRLHSEGIALIVAVRSDKDTELDKAGVDDMVLEGLDAAAAAELVTRYSTTAVVEEVAHRLARLTGGNPLALIECSRRLRSSQLTGAEPLDEPPPTGRRLQEAFSTRVRGLTREALRALLILASSDSTDKGLIGRALAAARIPPSAISEAETAGAIDVEAKRLIFAHPLLRAAVYHSASPEERREAHAALAEACAEYQLVERQAWHLANSRVLPDEKVGLALEEAAVRARQRGAHGAAGEAFEKAAALSPSTERRAVRLLEAGRDWHIHGNPTRAIRALDEALALRSDDPILRADIAQVQGRLQTWSGAVVQAHDLLLAEANAVETTDPQRAATLAIEAVPPACMAGRIDVAIATAKRAYELAARVRGSIEALAALMIVLPLAASGDHHGARTFLERGHSLAESADPITLGPVFAGLAEPLMWLGQDDEAWSLLNRVIGTARAQGLPSLLPFALALLAQVELRRDRFTVAYASASEGMVLAEDTDQQNQRGHNLACLARVEAALGKVDDCRRHIQESVDTERRFGASSLQIFYGAAQGHLELSLGRADVAVTALESVAEFVDRGGASHPELGRWAPDLIESYTRVGRRRDAASALDAFERRVHRSSTPWGRATLARCEALLVEGSYERTFRSALELSGAPVSRFERARTELCFGERLRRNGKRTEARRALTSALEVFESLPAPLWADKARRELRPSGPFASRQGARRSPSLTPQELQVAFIVARGATNKEAAAQLFLSPKTIEHHLGHIYAKLRVRSRTELANLVARDALLEGTRQPEQSSSSRDRGFT